MAGEFESKTVAEKVMLAKICEQMEEYPSMMELMFAVTTEKKTLDQEERNL